MGINSSYARRGFLILLLSLLIAAALFTTTYFPWRTYAEIEVKCTEAAPGVVPVESSQEQDGSYYYGPVVEFTDYSSGITLRAKAVNTVNLNKTWDENTPISIYYNPSDPTEFIIRDEHTAENHFKIASIIGIVLVSAGFAFFVIELIRTFKKPKIKSFDYDSNIAGQSFEEWQAQQLSSAESQPPLSTDTPNAFTENVAVQEKND